MHSSRTEALQRDDMLFHLEAAPTRSTPDCDLSTVMGAPAQAHQPKHKPRYEAKHKPAPAPAAQAGIGIEDHDATNTASWSTSLGWMAAPPPPTHPPPLLYPPSHSVQRACPNGSPEYSRGDASSLRSARKAVGSLHRHLVCCTCALTDDLHLERRREDYWEARG